MKSKSEKVEFTLISAVVLVLVLSVGYTINRSLNRERGGDRRRNETEQSVLPPVKYRHIALVNKNTGEMIFSYGSRSKEGLVERWGDWIFTADLNSDEAVINAYNLKTEEKKAITISGKNGEERASILSMKVIDNDLFVGVLSGDTRVKSYWINAAADSWSPVAITGNGFVEKRGSNLWLVNESARSERGGAGDYTWLNPLSKKPGVRIHSEFGLSNTGVEVIGMDGKQVIESTKKKELTSEGEQIRYTAISAVEIPSMKNTVLVQATKMPAQVKSVILFPQSRQIVIGGEGVYLFDITQMNMRLASQTTDWRLEGADTEKEEWCESQISKPGNKRMGKANGGQVSYRIVADCEWQRGAIMAVKIKEAVGKLPLPDNYALKAEDIEE